jgi:uncharacterized membrane protein
MNTFYIHPINFCFILIFIFSLRTYIKENNNNKTFGYTTTYRLLSRMVQDKFQRLGWRLIYNSIIWGILFLRNKIVF